jgi:hypothetical protein
MGIGCMHNADGMAVCGIVAVFLYYTLPIPILKNTVFLSGYNGGVFQNADK